MSLRQPDRRGAGVRADGRFVGEIGDPMPLAIGPDGALALAVATDARTA